MRRWAHFPKRGRILPRSWVVPLLLWLLLYGCAHGARTSEPRLPELSPLPPLVAPPLRLALQGQIARVKLSEHSDTLVPKVMAEAHRAALGPAGRARYRIVRGPITWDVNAQGVLASTTLKGKLRLCKPFGAACIEYGRCRPQWRSLTTFPWPEHHNWVTRPQLELELTQGCRLKPLGLDVSPTLRRISEEQRNKQEHKLTRSAELIAPPLRQAIAREQARLSERLFGGKRCLRLKSVNYDLQADEHDLVGSLLVEGALIDKPCDPGNADIELKRQPGLRGTTPLELWTQYPYAVISDALATRWGEGVRVLAGHDGHQPRLFVQSRAQGPSPFVEIVLKWQQDRIAITETEHGRTLATVASAEVIAKQAALAQLETWLQVLATRYQLRFDTESETGRRTKQGSPTVVLGKDGFAIVTTPNATPWPAREVPSEKYER